MATAAATAARPWDPTVSLRLDHPAVVLLERCRGGARPFKAILAHVLRLGLAFETFPMSRLLYFATVAFPQHTREGLLLFEHFTPRPNLYIYNLVLAALSPSQSRSVALYKSILASPAAPDERTFLALLRSVECPSVGKQVHAHVLVNGLQSRVYLRNSLIKMYLDAGDVGTAEALFRCAPVLDTVSCNIMLSGYAKGGFSLKSLQLFSVNTLLGRSVHAAVLRRMGLADRGLVLSNALLDMYAKCGEMNTALRVFAEAWEKDDISWNTIISGFADAGMLDLARKFFFDAPCRDLISWNVLLAGYARCREFAVVVELFNAMIASCIRPDMVTALTLISAAIGKGELNPGKSVHGWVVKEHGTQDAFLASALVDMYCKCGNVNLAYAVFEKALDKDVTLWTVMISGLAFHGHGTKALDLFWNMQKEGVAPNGVTLVAVLSACSHAGLLDEGCRLSDAVGLARTMPMKPSRSIWGSILSASSACQNTEVAEIASEELLRLEPTEEGGYVLLSNLYAAGGHWNYSDKVRETMDRRGMRKAAGASGLAINDATY
ncbi:hypothetical protein ACQ4PT_031011 [Festuca glaucescens]